MREQAIRRELCVRMEAFSPGLICLESQIFNNMHSWKLRRKNGPSASYDNKYTGILLIRVQLFHLFYANFFKLLPEGLLDLFQIWLV